MDQIHENLKLKEPNCTFRHQGTIKNALFSDSAVHNCFECRGEHYWSSVKVQVVLVYFIIIVKVMIIIITIL
jgi:hypothetical protein